MKMHVLDEIYKFSVVLMNYAMERGQNVEVSKNLLFSMQLIFACFLFLDYAGLMNYIQVKNI